MLCRLAIDSWCRSCKYWSIENSITSKSVACVSTLCSPSEEFWRSQVKRSAVQDYPVDVVHWTTFQTKQGSFLSAREVLFPADPDFYETRKWMRILRASFTYNVKRAAAVSLCRLAIDIRVDSFRSCINAEFLESL